MTARLQLIRRLSEDSLGGIATLHDVTDAERMLDAYRAEVLAEVGMPDFYQPGHTYTSAEFPEYGWKFRCDSVTTRPDDGEQAALGWRYFKGEWEPYAYYKDDWDLAKFTGTAATGSAS
ncbi:hypothetical protein ACFZBE_17815 [Streptomyces sp. NPDC008061]|uniref:hypothetical protein n=1 Tax=Streptomyces sp. NPDC008061 TaxID=3364805 RepID=UPI0036F01847